MYSSTLQRLIELQNSDKKLSGKLISQLDDIEMTPLREKFKTDDTVAIVYCLANNMDIPKCVACGNDTSLLSAKKGFRKFCSLQCAGNYNAKKYNPIRNKNRSQSLNIQYVDQIKSASEFYANEDKTIKEVADIYNIPHHRLRLYLHDNKLIRDDIKSIKHTKIWQDNNKFLTDGTLAQLVDCGHTTKTIADKFNISPNSVAIHARKQGIKWKNRSSYETMIEEFLIKNNIEYIKNDRQSIKPFEIDFYIPSHSMGIEINGEYWHSTKHKDKFYHLNKQEYCEKIGIHLMQFFTHELADKFDKIEDILKTHLKLNKFKLFARNTTLREICKVEAKKFLSENHLFGYSNSSICFGLFSGDDLVSVLTIRKPRFNANFDVEIIRFANKIGYNIVGGLSKYMSHLKQRYNNIISYAHRRLFTGRSYIKSGLVLMNQTTPGYFWYSQKHGIISRHQTQKHKLGTTLTENEYMSKLGFCKVFDCGQNVFAFNNAELVG